HWKHRSRKSVYERHRPTRRSRVLREGEEAFGLGSAQNADSLCEALQGHDRAGPGDEYVDGLGGCVAAAGHRSDYRLPDRLTADARDIAGCRSGFAGTAHFVLCTV